MAKKAKAAPTPVAEPQAAAPTPVAAEPEAPRPYAVLLDSQSVAYLQIGKTDKALSLIVNNGKAVEVISMDLTTAKNRDLQVIQNASILDGARSLYRPLSPACVVSKRAEEELRKILDHPEDHMPAKAAKASTKKGKAAKPAAEKKAASKANGSSSRLNGEAKITLLAKENPKREGSSSYKRFAKYKTGMTVAEFIKAGGTSGDVRYDVEHKFISVK